MQREVHRVKFHRRLGYYDEIDVVQRDTARRESKERRDLGDGSNLKPGLAGEST
jgi:hypothetical protein